MFIHKSLFALRWLPYLLNFSPLILRRGHFKQFSGWDILHPKCFHLVFSYMTYWTSCKKKKVQLTVGKLDFFFCMKFNMTVKKKQVAQRATIAHLSDPVPKTLCSFSPTPMMLHIKFDNEWPTGFRDIQVQKWVLWSSPKSNLSELLCLS